MNGAFVVLVFFHSVEFVQEMKQTVVLAFLLVAAFAFFAHAKTQWHQLDGYGFHDYVIEFNKQYKHGEYAMRREVFEARLIKIRAHNLNEEKTWKEGVNHLTDRTEAELKSMRGLRKELIASVPTKAQAFPGSISIAGIPDHVDWREKGIVSPVKDQGMSNFSLLQQFLTFSLLIPQVNADHAGESIL